MTLLKPAGPQETWAAHAQIVRLLATTFLSGSGVHNLGILQILGDPSALSVSVGPSIHFVDLGRYQGMGCYAVTDTEHRAVQAAPRTGCRVDVLGIQIWSQEQGDDHDDWDLVVLKGTVGSSTDPVPSPATAAWLPIARLGVCSGMTKGSQVLIEVVEPEAYPMREGGYQSGDLDVPAPSVIQTYLNVRVGTGGYCNLSHSFGEVPAGITFTGFYPTGGSPNIPAMFLLDKNNTDADSFNVRVLKPDGSSVDTGSLVAFDAVFHRASTDGNL